MENLLPIKEIREYIEKVSKISHITRTFHEQCFEVIWVFNRGEVLYINHFDPEINSEDKNIIFHLWPNFYQSLEIKNEDLVIMSHNGSPGSEDYFPFVNDIQEKEDEINFFFLSYKLFSMNIEAYDHFTNFFEVKKKFDYEEHFLPILEWYYFHPDEKDTNEGDFVTDVNERVILNKLSQLEQKDFENLRKTNFETRESYELFQYNLDLLLDMGKYETYFNTIFEKRPKSAMK